ncbi:dihydropteroate synthase [Nonlabens xylanidelens]|uniref:dihydropteroate synthase n=1 Tax=Nonlabens xylanidelens TaxID=191564 RepID=A0A2S6IHA6_9FLAO|nr:dihydropteroate synthase [Nonlabens xylanidelens]PPK93594.1 dihydropteroate synthase [Nonlabens xylanidelens]PQJ17823.1 dihydropteroate synthase [Nonlabens xylanidelens]
MATINCTGTLIDLSTPHTMGIVNCTPDSFYDGGRLKNDAAILNQVETMLDAGATFIDVGGYSSRPDGTDISVEEELSRVLPVLDLITARFDIKGLSCDSFRESVIEKAINHGATIVNDISAGILSENTLQTVGKAKIPYIMMHMRGTPQSMKTMTDYENMVVEINRYFSERVAAARACGINDLIIDPGFGFAKSTQQNFELLSDLDLLKAHRLPILAGISRKSMIYKTLDSTAQESLNGTTALNMVCLMKGAKILRVHDVKEAMETIALYNQLTVN